MFHMVDIWSQLDLKSKPTFCLPAGQINVHSTNFCRLESSQLSTSGIPKTSPWCVRWRQETGQCNKVRPARDHMPGIPSQSIPVTACQREEKSVMPLLIFERFKTDKCQKESAFAYHDKIKEFKRSFEQNIFGNLSLEKPYKQIVVQRHSKIAIKNTKIQHY